ncbi:MAG: hypothetical protein F4X51_21415 [Gemmatimonadetes bacterium]|nr:hypothetical protein [Gemmatimonadota bacterium]
MSKIAHKEYKDASNRQRIRNEARTIRTKVYAAQNTPSAGVRWPFELIQNAHDAGPRDGDQHVEISFTFKDNDLVVSHTGKPFTARELAALLSGGSSKDFDDEETTGRFGTGFLVTHALSTCVDVDGVLFTQEGHEFFHIKLARGGDEKSIVENIEQSNESLANAKPLSKSCIARNPTASFAYYDADCEVAKWGLDRLEQVLPYLYVTCEKLGQVRIERPHGTTFFKPANTTKKIIDGFVLKLTEVTVSQDETTRQLTALRIGSQNAQSALLVVLENGDSNRHRVLLPADNFPRIFVKLPITETNFLPFKVVLEGSFDPTQERNSIAMNQNDRDLISTAMEVFPTLVQHAVEFGWRDAHKLAHLAIPKLTLSGEGSDELGWWKNIIVKIAKATAAKPIIDTEEGLLPALQDDGKNVTFLVPATDLDGQNPIDYDTIYELASRITDIQLPTKDFAQDWEQIAYQWEEIGLPVTRLSLTELTDWVKEKGQDITDLPISEDPFKWLANLFLLIADADLPESVNVKPLVAGLMPNQNSQLRSLPDLRIDEDIPEKIKDIADSIGIDLRSKLLHKNVVEALNEPGYESAKAFIFKLLGESYTETEAVKNIFDELDECLPDGSEFDKETYLPALCASAHLAIYLAEKDDSVQYLRECPLLTAANKIIRLTGSQQILSPVSHWPQSAQPYVDLYTKNRLLSDHYCNDRDLNGVLIPLIAAGLVIGGPLYKATRSLDRNENLNLLKAMALESQEAEEVTVRNEDFGQIAFLSTDIVNRCGQDIKLAKRLLDFVLNVAARKDQSWGEIKEVSGTRSGDPVKLSVHGATWPFELKVRSWVPVETEDGETLALPANDANLWKLLDSTWLQNNPHAIDLLHSVFGFRQLTLMTENLEPEVESNLVKLLQDPILVKSAVTNLDVVKAAVENPETVRLISEADPEEIQEIRKELENRNRQAEIREYNRSFGHAVQEMLAEVIQLHGLDLQLVDIGYDYKVLPDQADSSLDDASFSFEVGSYFLEVKTTTTGDVRLTPLQAQTASDDSDRFVLCVIDLRGQEIPESGDLAKVKQFAKIVTDIGNDIFKVYEGVDKLTSVSNPVRLHNEKQLRYGVSKELWENGISIDKWIKSLRIKA